MIVVNWNYVLVVCGLLATCMGCMRGDGAIQDCVAGLGLTLLIVAAMRFLIQVSQRRGVL